MFTYFQLRTKVCLRVFLKNYNFSFPLKFHIQVSYKLAKLVKVGSDLSVKTLYFVNCVLTLSWFRLSDKDSSQVLTSTAKYSKVKLYSFEVTPSLRL